MGEGNEPDAGEIQERALDQANLYRDTIWFNWWAKFYSLSVPFVDKDKFWVKARISLATEESSKIIRYLREIRATYL